MQRAVAELTAARDLLTQRQAAEKGYLALTSAVEVATRAPIQKFSEELERVQLVARRARDPHIVADYKALRRVLHGNCFHQAQCGNVGFELGRAAALVDRILRTRTPRR